MDLNEVIKQLTAERDAAMREASELAMCIWRSEFRNESPEFELCDSPAGVISQIDNMFAGIRQQRDALAKRIGIAERVESIFSDAPELSFDYCKRLFSAEIAEIKADVVEKYYYMGWEHSLSTKAKDGDHYGCGKRLAKEFADQVRQGE